jgi:hypothetical protein
MSACDVYNPPYNADFHVQTKKTGQVARMQLSVTRTLLLAAVGSVIMASVPVPVTGSAAAGPAGSGTGRVARFLCAHCTTVHVDWRAFPPRHVSQPVQRTAPHRRLETVPRCEHGHPGDPIGGPGRRRHGRRGGRCGARAGRPTSASR